MHVSMNIKSDKPFPVGSHEAQICDSSKDYQTFNGKTADSCADGQFPHIKVFMTFIYSVHLDCTELFIYDTHQCTSDMDKYSFISLLMFQHRSRHPQGALHQGLKLTKTQYITKLIHLHYSILYMELTTHDTGARCISDRK
jgi:hypothetical protein